MSETSIKQPVNGYDFARAIIEQKGDEAIEILLDCAHQAETDWLEKKAAVYPSEVADPDYRKLLGKLQNAPEETRRRELAHYEGKLLKEIACAIVALHNSRGGVVLIGIDDNNVPVPLGKGHSETGTLSGPEVESFIRRDILGRLCPGEGLFDCKGESWTIPVQETGVYPKVCRFHGSRVVALLVPSLKREGVPLVATITRNNHPRDMVLMRKSGDVGQTLKGRDEDRWVDTEHQRKKFYEDRDRDFLFHDDLETQVKRLGISVSSIPFSPFTSVPSTNVFSSVNPPRATFFVGREKELTNLHNLLQKGRIPIVTGPGGTGKSELVFQYAEQHKADYPGGLFQINMETVKNWDEAFEKLGTDAKVREILALGNLNNQLIASGVRQAMRGRSEMEGGILLVLDNVESAKAFFKEPMLETLKLPRNVHMLATARSSDNIFRPFDRAMEFPLPDLSSDEALELLLTERPSETDAERQAAAEIARRLDCRALYLRAIPALLDDPYSPIAGSYLALLSELREKMIETVDSAMEEYSEEGRKPSVLWTLTRETLLRHPAGASWVKLAHIVSFFSTEGFNPKLLRHLWGTLAAPEVDTDCAFSQALDVLRRHGLITGEDAHPRMHSLTASALRRSAQESDLCLEADIGRTLASFEAMNPEDWLALTDSMTILRYIPQTVFPARREWFYFLPFVFTPSLQVRILLKNSSFEERVMWHLFYDEDWLALLEKKPEFATHCPWEKLNGKDFCRLLASQPQFADRCPWETLDGKSWSRLLARQPQFADHCPWEKLDGTSWSHLLARQPQFADLCPWETLDGKSWSHLLASQPQFADRCPWETLDATNWSDLIANQPRFADLCPWETLDGKGWSHLLASQPQFADRCPWETLDGDSWSCLLTRQPQFADRCPWEELKGGDWSFLLAMQPQFAYCCPWEKLDRTNWTYLLFRQPQFADRCPWEKFDGGDWACLLSERPQFADHCPWEKLSEGDWSFLLAMQPQFADRCPWGILEGSSWSNVLMSQPQLARHCLWEKLKGNDWSYLLAHQPLFADRCPWETLDGEDWAVLIVNQPRFADRCPWGKLNSSDWEYLLRYLPQFGIYRKSPSQT